MADPSTWTPPVGPIVDHGHISRNLNISLIVIAGLFFVHRVYIRLIALKNWGADDYAATIAFGFLMALSAFEIIEVKHGAGKHISDVHPKDLEAFFFNLPTMQLLYMSTSYFIKLAIILFLLRFHNSKRYKQVVWVALIATTIQALVIFFLFAFQCRPPKALWVMSIKDKTCMSSANQAKLFYAHAGLGIIIDAFCIAAPLFVIWKHLMFRDMQIRLTAIFGVGTFGVVCAIIRFSVIVTVDMGVDTTFNISKASIWNNLEVFIGFYVSCFPSLSPTFKLLRRMFTGQSTTGNTNEGKPSNTIALNMQRAGSKPSVTHSVSMHGKGGDVEIPMYTVSHTKSGTPNGSEDNIAADDGNMYSNLEFKVHVDKEVYSSSKV